LPTPTYSVNSLKANVLSAVAKFPDGDMIGFQANKNFKKIFLTF